MSKALGRAALIVGSIVVTAVAGPYAGAALMSLGSAVSSLTAPKPRFDAASSGTDWQADPYAGLPYAMGETASGGKIVYRRTDDAWAGGAENDLQTIVTVHSCAGPIQSIDGVDIDRNAVTFNASTGAASGALADYVWWKGQLGATPESAQLNIAAGSSTAPAGWTSAHKLSGLAADMVRLRYDSKGERFGLGEPQRRVRGKWVKVYDPRLDSTYPGGSGACRPFNESTYVWSRNPHLHALTWAMGRYSNGKLVAGLGLAMADIIVDEFIEGANICDAHDWFCDGVIFTRPQSAWNNLKLILSAAAAVPYNTGGRVGCRNQMPRVAVGSITAGDLRGEATRPATRPRRERKNVAFYRFRSVDQDYEVIDAGAPVRIADFVTADGGEERPMTVELPLVQSVDQAAVVAAYEICESREADPLTYSLGPRFYNFKPGDCLTDDTPEGGGQLLRIERRTMDPESQIVTLVCRTETTSKHDRALGVTGQAPVIVAPPAVPLGPAAPASDAWSASGTALSATGGAIPALVISGGADNPAATEILFWYRPTGGDGVWRAAGSAGATATRHEITAVTPGTEYDVAISYRVRGVIGARRTLGPVTAGNPALVWANVTGDGRPQDGATNTAPANANRLRFTGFEGGKGWGNSGDVVGPIYTFAPSPGVISINMQVTFTADGQRSFLFSTPPLPVRAGQRLSAASFIDAFAVSGPPPGAWQVYLGFQNAAGVDFATELLGGGTGNAPSATRFAAFAVAPTGAVTMNLVVFAEADGAGVVQLGIRQPMLADAATGQTLHPAFVPGPNADDGADVTADQAVVSRLDTVTGLAASNFRAASTGSPFAQLVASGSARDGDVVTFPATLPAPPKIFFLPGGNAPTAGQNVRIKAEGLSASGFTMVAKSQVVTVGSTITDLPSSAGGTGEPALVINRSNSGAPFDGTFSFRVAVTVGEVAPGEPGSITLAFFVRRSGAWQETAREAFSVSGNHDVLVSPGPVDFGTGAEFGVTAVALEGTGTALTDFVHVRYTLGSVTEVSLTPSGASAIPWQAFL